MFTAIIMPDVVYGCVMKNYFFYKQKWVFRRPKIGLYSPFVHNLRHSKPPSDNFIKGNVHTPPVKSCHRPASTHLSSLLPRGRWRDSARRSGVIRRSRERLKDFLDIASFHSRCHSFSPLRGQLPRRGSLLGSCLPVKLFYITITFR